MKKDFLPVILLAVGAAIVAAVSFAAKKDDCCQSAKSCCKEKGACCETTPAAVDKADCCQPVQDCCESVGDCCGPVNERCGTRDDEVLGGGIIKSAE